MNAEWIGAILAFSISTIMTSVGVWYGYRWGFKRGRAVERREASLRTFHASVNGSGGYGGRDFRG